jgi:hypothetical protein
MLLEDDENAARDVKRALDLGGQGTARAWALLARGELLLRNQDTRAVSVLTEASIADPSLATA